MSSPSGARIAGGGAASFVEGAPNAGQQAAILRASDVSVSYATDKGSFDAVSAVSLDIAEGEFVSIIGPSGCGKSTLLRAFGGLTGVSQGEITMNGDPITGPNAERVGFVFQDYTLFPWRTVLHNTEIGLQFRGMKRGEREDVARRYLDLVGLGWCADKYPSELSGGMQQRVAIARALATDPAVLLMDEPFGALDEQTRMLLGTELAAIVQRTRKTVVLVTHSLAEAVFLSNRIVIMSARPGRVKEVVDVPTDLPRSESFMTSKAFDEIRSRVFESLIDEVHAQAKVNEQLQKRDGER
jgi:NitT/TauT family transport system ATP-binding protein